MSVKSEGMSVKSEGMSVKGMANQMILDAVARHKRDYPTTTTMPVLDAIEKKVKYQVEIVEYACVRKLHLMYYHLECYIRNDSNLDQCTIELGIKAIKGSIEHEAAKMNKRLAECGSVCFVKVSSSGQWRLTKE